MKLSRESLLTTLESLSPGLAIRELSVEQSSCFVFTEGKVFTFNDEVACSRDSPLKIEGAIKAKSLLSLLGKLPEDVIDVTVQDGELRVKGKGRRASLWMEEKIYLQIDAVENPSDWHAVPQDFSDAVRIVHTCSSREDKFALMCVHIHPNYMEACDRSQIARYPIETQVTKSTLVRAESLKSIVGFDVTEMCETPAWIHFRNPSGLIISCRRTLDDYDDLDRFLSSEGTEKMTLPGSLEEIVKRAEIFSEDNIAGNHVLVRVKEDRVIVEGEGPDGKYQEMREVSYSGRPVTFMIAPKLLVEITKKSNDCRISEDRLFIDTGKFLYACSTYHPETVTAGDGQ